MSNFAFGTYRISDLNPQHIEALKAAIDSEVQLIDTSTNYMDGGAERAIALAFRSFKDDVKKSILIVSKFGYIQNSNMQAHKEEPFEEVVEYSDSCYHSISPSFMKNQLTASLKRLELTKLDCYLIHNPEYYLLDAINKGVEKDKRLDEMYSRIYKVFVALEEEIAKGRIGSYGISSNSFSLKPNAVDFLPYEDLLVLAQNAADEIKNEKHGFTTIELPINLLEQEGLKCAEWAKENSLRVLVNRPLNAVNEGLMLRLADYDESLNYYHHLNELMQACDNEKLESLYTLLEQLDNNRHKFGWIGDYDSFLYSQIIPHIKKSLDSVDDEYAASLFSSIDMFLQEYRNMVLFECSKSVREKFKDELSECNTSLQAYALTYLKELDCIDFVLVGMRRPSYVHQVLGL